MIGITRGKVITPKLGKIIFAALLALCGGLVYSRTAMAQDVHPVVDAGEGCLMGGVARGKWLEADAVAPMIKGGERDRVYALTKQLGEVVGGNTASAGEPC